MRKVVGISVATLGLLVAGAAPAFAEKPESVPPSGRTCGATYGAAVTTFAQARMFSGELNPGVVHQGFAVMEAFLPTFCPSP